MAEFTPRDPVDGDTEVTSFWRDRRIGHLTSIDSSLYVLLGTELAADVAVGAKVYALSAPGDRADQLASIGVEHVGIPSLRRAWDPLADARAARELANTLRKLQLDVLHTHMPKGGIMGRIIGRMAGIPIVVNTCHGLWVRAEDPRLMRWGVLLAEGLASRFSDAELYQNQEDHDRMRWAVGSDRGQVVGNGVDLGRFRFDPVARMRVRAAWSVGEDELLVGAVGRIIESKGVFVFAEAARRLAGRARFVWIGQHDQEHPDAIAACDGPVEFVGLQSDMPAVLSALDVFVHPSYAREGLSRASMEAAAIGRPIVITDVRGCREIGRPYEDVLLVAPRSADQLTGALDVLLSDRRLRERLGASAQRRAMVRFDQMAVASSSLRTYEEVARRKGLDRRWGRPLPPR